MILGLENPSSAASTVIASVLIGSGIGSALGGRIRSMRSPRILLVLAGTVLLYSLLLPGTIGAMSGQSLMIRIVLSFCIVMPAGVLMGIPFPLGISIIGSTAPHLVPWAWAVNGCFSVIAPILAIMLALSTGYQFVLLCGAAAYMAAFWVIRRGGDAAKGPGEI